MRPQGLGAALAGLFAPMNLGATTRSTVMMAQQVSRRLVSPSLLGELVKPSLFLDLATFERDDRIPMASKHVRGVQ